MRSKKKPYKLKACSNRDAVERAGGPSRQQAQGWTAKWGADPEGLLDSFNLNLQATGSSSKVLSKQMTRLIGRYWCGEKKDLRTGPTGGRGRGQEAWTKAVAVALKEEPHTGTGWKPGSEPGLFNHWLGNPELLIPTYFTGLLED